MTEYARKFLTTLELTCYERNIDAPQTRERQQLLTNALNRYYLQNVMLRLYLQTGYVTIQDEKLVKQFEDELNITGKIFSALLLDAQPRKKSDAIRYNKLWFRTQMTLAHDKDTLERAIDYGLESEERSALVSVYLVSRLRSMINSVRKDDLIERNIIFVYLLVDLAIMKEKIANIHKNKQAYLYQMMIDLYYIGVRFASNPKEIALIADAPMLAFMFSLPEKTNRCDMNTFLLSAHTTNISSSYSNRVGNNVHEMKRELQNIESEFNFVRKALAKAIARLKSERMGGMNYLVQQDFITDALLVASSQDNQESLQT